MDPLWFYSRNGQQTGPVPFEELRRLARRGELLPTDLVWQQGSPGWTPAHANTELFPGSSVPPIPPPISNGGNMPEEVISLDDPEPLVEESRPARKSRRKSRDDDDAEADDRDRRRSRRGRDDDDDRPRKRRQDDPIAAVFLHVERTFGLDMQVITPMEDEKRQLDRAGIEDEASQRYAVWRRSTMLIAVLPCFLAALFHIIDGCSDNGFSALGAKGLGPFATVLLIIDLLSRVALPIAVLLAAMSFQHLGKSFQYLGIGWAIAFFVPILTALVPSDWYVDYRENGTAFRVGMGVALGFVFFLGLMPSVLALIPGVIRASVRVKHLLPESIAPGWGLLGSAPLSLLFSLAVFVLIYHLASNLLLLMGVLLFLGAPLIYLWRYELFIRPLTKSSHLRALSQLRLYALVSTYVGIGLILVFMLTTKIGGAYLLGFSTNDALRPWSLVVHKTWIDYMARSLLTTVLFADLLMRMNLSIWRQEKEFYRTEKAAVYDEVMETVGKSIETKENRRGRRARHEDHDGEADRERDEDDA